MWESVFYTCEDTYIFRWQFTSDNNYSKKYLIVIYSPRRQSCNFCTGEKIVVRAFVEAKSWATYSNTLATEGNLLFHPIKKYYKFDNKLF